jgi:FixJ family two-component response regulator
MRSSSQTHSLRKVPSVSAVFIVDEDPVHRESVRNLMTSIKLHVVEFSSGVDFLEYYDRSQPGCLILDLRMADMSGLDLLRKLAADNDHLPSIVLSAFADVRTTVEAMKLGAIDVLEKPFQPQELLEDTLLALNEDRKRCDRSVQDATMTLHLQHLTPREDEVLSLLLVGKTAKQIAKDLRISIRTVDFHRRNLLEKMKVDNVVQLTRMVDEYRFRHRPAMFKIVKSR